MWWTGTRGGSEGGGTRSQIEGKMEEMLGQRGAVCGRRKKRNNNGGDGRKLVGQEMRGREKRRKWRRGKREGEKKIKNKFMF